MTKSAVSVRLGTRLPQMPRILVKACGLGASMLALYLLVHTLLSTQGVVKLQVTSVTEEYSTDAPSSNSQASMPDNRSGIPPIVFTHMKDGTGTLPGYIHYTLAQARCSNPNAPIYLISSQYAVDNFEIDPTLRVEKVGIESLPVYPKEVEFREKGGFPQEGFWIGSIARFFIAHRFLKKFGIKEAFLMEADNQIFVDYAELLPTFRKYYKNIGGVVERSNYGTMCASIIYVGNSDAWENLVERFHWLEIIPEGRQAMVDHHVKMGTQGSDMSFLAWYLLNDPGKRMEELPTLPSGPHSMHVDEFNVVFDAMSYGQYAFGIDDGQARAFRDPAHAIGSEMIEEKIEMIWEDGRSKIGTVPVVVEKATGRKITVANMHFHNKVAIRDFYNSHTKCPAPKLPANMKALWEPRIGSLDGNLN